MRLTFADCLEYVRDVFNSDSSRIELKGKSEEAASKRRTLYLCLAAAVHLGLTEHNIRSVKEFLQRTFPGYVSSAGSKKEYNAIREWMLKCRRHFEDALALWRENPNLLSDLEREALIIIVRLTPEELEEEVIGVRSRGSKAEERSKVATASVNKSGSKVTPFGGRSSRKPPRTREYPECVDGGAHKVKIDPPNGPTSLGRCVKPGCTFVDEYINSQEEGGWR